MTDYTIYHNPRCSKSRQTLALLEAAGIEPTIVSYLQTPLTKAQLQDILKKLNIAPKALVRKGEAQFKPYKETSASFNDEQWLDLMVELPILIERPIVVSGSQAVLGRPPENVQALLP